MGEKFIIVLDQGSSSSRALAFDEAGNIRFKSQRKVEASYPAPGRAEYDAEKLYASQADSLAELFAAIRASFGPDVGFVLQPKQLVKVEPLKALNRIQVQLSALYPEKRGYVLVDFSEPLDDQYQAVLVYGCDLDRVMELAVQVGIYAAPAYESLRASVESAG